LRPPPPPTAPSACTISVCIPTHNRAGDLAERMVELSAQTAKSFEVVVVDDGSTDTTAEVVADAARRGLPVRHVALRPGIGMPWVIARCFAEARNSLVAIFHDHDSYGPDVVERLAQALQEHPSAAFAFCGVRTCDPLSGAVVSDSSEPAAAGLRHDVVAHFVRSGSSLVGASAVMVRRSALPPEPLVTAELGLFADVELWCRLALRAPAVYVPGPLVDVQGWGPDEGLVKLNWTKLGQLRELRLRFATELAADPRVRSRQARWIAWHTACARAHWTARLLRRAHRSGVFPGAVGGAPRAVRVAAAVLSAARRKFPPDLLKET